MRCANLDHVRNRRLPVVTRQPDTAGIYDHSPIPKANHSWNVSVSAQDELGVDSFGSSLNNVDRACTYAAVDGHVVEPKSSIVPWRSVTKEHFFSMHKRWWHARHPIEVLALSSGPRCLPARVQQEFDPDHLAPVEALAQSAGLPFGPPPADRLHDRQGLRLT